jgi:hypothetical protein
MEDRFAKYSKLYFLIFLLFLSIPVIFGSVMALLYGVSKLVSSKPVDILFELVVISIPSAVFATVYYIFIKRTKKHPSVIVKTISQVCFIIGFCYCVIVLALCIIEYFKLGIHDITNYKSFDLIFLASNIGLLFFISILQAFTAKKEINWMEKRKQKEGTPS